VRLFLADLGHFEAFKEDWHKDYLQHSKRKTPQYDKAGNRIIQRRPWDNLEYVPEGYMRKALDQYFPGWSWLPVGGTQIIVQLGWVVVDGQLAIIDPRLVAMGIHPPYRYFHGNGAARITTKKDMPISAASIVDLDKVVKSANSEAFKVAVNRLTFICDDVYGKRVETEGVTAEDIASGAVEIPSGAAQQAFNDFVRRSGKPYSEVFKALGVTNMAGVTDYAKALRDLQEVWK